MTNINEEESSRKSAIVKILYCLMVFFIFFAAMCGFKGSWLALPIFLGLAVITMSVILFIVKNDSNLVKYVALSFILVGICCFIFSGIALTWGLHAALLYGIPIIVSLVFGSLGIGLIYGYKKNGDRLFLTMGILFFVCVVFCLLIFLLVSSFAVI